jgi:hypothetical protein
MIDAFANYTDNFINLNFKMTGKISGIGGIGLRAACRRPLTWKDKTI